MGLELIIKKDYHEASVITYQCERRAGENKQGATGQSHPRMSDEVLKRQY